MKRSLILSLIVIAIFVVLKLLLTAKKKTENRNDKWAFIKEGQSAEDVGNLLGDPEVFGATPTSTDVVETFYVYRDGTVFFQKAKDNKLRVIKIERR